MAEETTAGGEQTSHYDTPGYDYSHYWSGRAYEHGAEEMAIRHLLEGSHFADAVDIGGGYGRLTVLLAEYADRITLVDSSQQQLDHAEIYLRDHPEIRRQRMWADNLQFPDKTFNLVTMIRVLHHIPDPTDQFAELARVMRDDGTGIIEVANYGHAKNRVKYMLRGKRLPLTPVDIRSPGHRSADEIPFVDHNPRTVRLQLARAGLRVDEVLSVSNLRSPVLKRLLPTPLLLAVESTIQRPLARSLFGPSIFFRVRRSHDTGSPS